ncbi:MAG: protease HtpX [Elusimicrobia bacterium]|nr:protease HtpX [Elusimicrobiota bacterium]
MKRVFLFFAVNLLVVLTISFFVNLLGIRPYLSAQGVDYGSLLVFCAMFGFGGAFVSLQLSRWMAKTAMGVQVLDPDRPGGAVETRLVAEVRDLCRRAGLSVLPEIGLYDSPEVNAFATGPSRSRALLAVSTGLLRAMDDRAVRGVLGHEVAHIANGDMVTMTLLQGVVNTFVMFLARVGAMAIDSALRSRDEEGRGGLGYFGHYMLVSVLETVLMLFASPVIYYFSRVREYRADRGSAGYLGAPVMIHALEQLRDHKEAVDAGQPALATFKINGGASGVLAKLFSSHPPIEKRIAALRNV